MFLASVHLCKLKKTHNRTREAVHKKIDEGRISKEAASMKRDKRCSRIDGSYRRRDDHTSGDMRDMGGGMQHTGRELSA
jgi:hypothetical protein